MMNIKQIIGLVVVGILLAFFIFTGFMWLESLDAEQIMVIQSPFKGTLTWHKTPGVKWQGLGTVTKYPKRVQFWFSMQDDQGKKGVDESIPIRFNDGGHGKISGSLAWEMPISDDKLTNIHMKYRGADAVQQQLVRTVVEKAVYMTGPMMSSQESYASRRNELLNIIDDQIMHGVYKTETKQERAKDPMTGIEKTINVVNIIRDSKGNPLRQDTSPLQDFGIRVFNLSINKIPYDAVVEEQIKTQQKAIMMVQTNLVQAREAEQKVITAAKEGEANAVKAKWEQEVIKAKEVTKAEQEKTVAITDAEKRLKVAELDKQASEQFKLSEILKGEGEATRKKLVMEADGALEKKIEAFVIVNSRYADAIKEYRGNWVPGVVMGGNATSTSSGAQQLIDLLTVKTAKDLGLDISISSEDKTQGFFQPTKKK